MNRLINIGKILQSIKQKDDRHKRLIAELTKINLNLPARVWLPLNSDQPHHIVRIPSNVAAVLNSKDKVGVFIFLFNLFIFCIIIFIKKKSRITYY